MLNKTKLAAVELGGSEHDAFLQDVTAGLSATRKTLDPKYFYDDRGSRLFQQITELPEYYITRTETQMMQDSASDIGSALAKVSTVIEFGSGSGERTDLLLQSLPAAERYVPIDVSDELLASTAATVGARHPHIQVHALNADFTAPMTLPVETGYAPLGYFPGSTIGNFLPTAATRFLVNARKTLGANADLLVGVDLVKPVKLLEDAYNDSRGVTAAFNLNILARINSELNGNFDLSLFAHQAFYSAELSRIEMHLVSLAQQEVVIDGTYSFTFRVGETIHTENSHKYTIERFKHMATQAGWRPARCWVDEDRLFSLHLLRNTA